MTVIIIVIDREKMKVRAIVTDRKEIDNITFLLQTQFFKKNGHFRKIVAGY